MDVLGNHQDGQNEWEFWFRTNHGGLWRRKCQFLKLQPPAARHGPTPVLTTTELKLAMSNWLRGRALPQRSFQEPARRSERTKNVHKRYGQWKTQLEIGFLVYKVFQIHWRIFICSVFILKCVNALNRKRREIEIVGKKSPPSCASLLRFLCIFFVQQNLVGIMLWWKKTTGIKPYCVYPSFPNTDSAI